MGKLLLFALSSMLLFHAYSKPLPDLSKFKDLTKQQESGQIFADSFDRGNKGWRIHDNFKIMRSAGTNGTSAMYYERTDPKSCPFLLIPVKLRSDQVYRISFQVRLADIKRHGALSRGEFSAVFYYKNNKYYGGGYSKNKFDLKSEDWQTVSFKFQPSEGFDTSEIVLYMMRDYTGKIWWDNLRVEVAGSLTGTIYDLAPKNLQFDDKSKIAFGAALYAKPKPQNTAILVSAGNTTKLIKKKNGIYAGALGKLPYGKIKVEAYLLDLDKKNILDKKTFNFFHTENNIKPKGYSHFDKYGRAIVGGKPFMPIGMFGHALTEKQIKRLADNNFNFFMSYWSVGMTPEGKFLHNKNTYKNLDACMDLYKKYGVKLLFSIMNQRKSCKYFRTDKLEGVVGVHNVIRAVVNRYKNHPALLGWYISDENPREEVPLLRKMRETVCGIDPNHFTVTLTYEVNNFPFFASTGDVLCPDAYPIVKSRPKQSMTKITKTMASAAQLKMPLWFAPQAFNYGLEKTKPGEPNYKEYRWPTSDEIFAMTLAGAIHGAKGFMYYSHSFIFKYADRFEPGSAKKAFKSLAAAVKKLKQLEPFILSIKAVPQVKIESTSSGIIEVKGWYNDHNNEIRVAVIGVDGGENKGVFFVKGHPALKSKNGSTVNLGGGKYCFTGKNISYDILY